jgi:uncharacterized protein YndB with AHSA1/START domain
MAVKEQTPRTLDVSLDIAAAPELAFQACFQDAALSAWMGTSRSIALPRLLGPFVLEWPTSESRDEVLGRLGGVLRGTVMHIEPNDHVFLADTFWLPPDGAPLGPFALELTFTPASSPEGRLSTVVRVAMSGFDEGPRWRRYHEIATGQWQRSLRVLKMLLEK